MSAYLPEAKYSIPRDGGNLSYFRYGKPSSKNILAIHGVTSSNRAWQCFAKTLNKFGFTIYAVDLRGRGDSNSIQGPFGMAKHAADMEVVLDHANIDACDVIGHSMGGFVVTAMTAISPTRIDRAVLIDGGIPLALPPGFTAEMVLPLVLGPALARLAMTFQNQDEYLAYWKPQAAFERGWSEVLDEYVTYDLRGKSPNMQASTNAKAVEADSADLFGDPLIVNALLNLNSEVLFIRAVRGLQNEEIPLYPQSVIEAALENYPKVKLLTLDDVNHYEILLDQGFADRCIDLVYPELNVLGAK